MLNRQILEVVAADTWLRRLDARTKLGAAMIICLLSLLLDTPITLYALLMVILFLHLEAKTSAIKWAVMIFMMLAGIWGSVVSQAIFYAQDPRTPILCLLTADVARPFLKEGLYLYKEGLTYGALQAMRSSLMLAAGMLLCWTTDLRDMLKSLLYWKMPYPLAFMTIASLRFLPDIISETMTVITAQRLRGFQPMRSLQPQKMLQTFYQLLFPVLARTIRRATTLSLSVEARGFGRSGQQLPEMITWHYGRICLAIAWCILGALGIIKILYWLQFGGLWYSAILRPIYDFAKYWL